MLEKSVADAAAEHCGRAMFERAVDGVLHRTEARRRVIPVPHELGGVKADHAAF